jgi:hypothetical protein
MNNDVSYSHDIIPIELLLVHIVNQKKQSNDLAYHRFVVQLIILCLHPNTQKLEEVSQQVDVPAITVELLNNFSSEDGCQL